MIVLWALGVTWAVSAIYFLLMLIFFPDQESWWNRILFGLLWPVFIFLQLVLFCLEVMTDFVIGLLELWGTAFDSTFDDDDSSDQE